MTCDSWWGFEHVKLPSSYSLGKIRFGRFGGKGSPKTTSKQSNKIPKKLPKNYPKVFGIGSNPPFLRKCPKESLKKILQNFWIRVEPPTPAFGNCPKVSVFLGFLP